MAKYKKIMNLKMGSISYVHDPEAAQQWFEIYIEVLKQELLKTASKQLKELNKH
jgi:hypothetical protein